MILSFEELGEDGILRCKLNGEYDFEGAQAAIQKIILECEHRKIQKAFIDMMELDKLLIPDMERYHIGKEIGKVWGYKLKGAFLAPDNTINKFMENVANNRAAHVKVDSDKESLSNWLKGE